MQYVSPHDLRRSFGTRWAKRVKKPALMRWIRHESIQTMMAYHESLECAEIAEELEEGGSVAASGSNPGEG